jgi:manganese transport protein
MQQIPAGVENSEKSRSGKGRRRKRFGSLRQFLLYVGPALMVSIAYMDPGNYGTDLQAGAGFKFGLVWAVWLASGMAMLLQYLSGKLGIASGYSLAELVRQSLRRRGLVISYWLGAEIAAAATDLAEYLGTVIALNLLFGIPLLYAAIFGAFDVLIIMAMATRKFRVLEQFFMLLTSVLVIGLLYQLFVVKPSFAQVAYHSVVPGAFSYDAILLVVGIVGATVMPHALFVHSWLTKNKLEMTDSGKLLESRNGTMNNGISPASKADPPLASSSSSPPAQERAKPSLETKQLTRKLHMKETILFLTIAAVVNVGILLVATPLYPNPNITIQETVQELGRIFAPIVGTIFILTLLASGLLSSTLGTLSGQVIMEGLIEKRWNIWARRIVTRFVNVFPTTIAILLRVNPLSLLIYSQVILSLMIPLPMIPLVYYTSKRKFMGELVNSKLTTVFSIITVALIVGLNSYLILAGI